MTEINFEELMGTDIGDVHQAPPLPNGWYRATIEAKQNVTSSRKGTPGIEFTFSNWREEEEVDEDDLREYNEHPAGGLPKYSKTDSFWVTPKALPMLKEFIEKCGGPSSGPLMKCCEDIIGNDVCIEIRQNVADSGRTFAEIRGYKEAN